MSIEDADEAVAYGQRHVSTAENMLEAERKLKTAMREVQPLTSMSSAVTIRLQRLNLALAPRRMQKCRTPLICADRISRAITEMTRPT